MRISVLMPVYNGAAFVQRALDSVHAQTRPADEIIVVDDGSTDATPEILRRNQARITVLTQPNRGRSAARNAGLERATGDYVAFLDADDAFLPAHLAQLEQRAQHEPGEIVFDCLAEPFFPAGARVPRKPEERHAWRHLVNCQIWIQTAMVARPWVLAHNLRFDPELQIAEDALFFWQMLLLGARVCYVRQRGTQLGIHPANTTADAVATYLATLRAYDRLEDFVRERRLCLPAAWRHAIRQGRRHKQIMAQLLALRAAGPAERRAALSPLLRAAFAPAPTRGLERLRCLLALGWLLGLGRGWRAWERLLFGFSICRSDTLSPP